MLQGIHGQHPPGLHLPKQAIQENVQWSFKRSLPATGKQIKHQSKNPHQGRKGNAAHDAKPISNGIWIFAWSLLWYHPWRLAQISLMETGLNPSRMDFFCLAYGNIDGFPTVPFNNPKANVLKHWLRDIKADFFAGNEAKINWSLMLL
jgi:hypothetical protein